MSQLFIYLSDIAAPGPAQPHFIVTTPSQFVQGSGSDQTTGWGVYQGN